MTVEPKRMKTPLVKGNRKEKVVTELWQFPELEYKKDKVTSFVCIGPVEGITKPVKTKQNLGGKRPGPFL